MLEGKRVREIGRKSERKWQIENLNLNLNLKLLLHYNVYKVGKMPLCI